METTSEVKNEVKNEVENATTNDYGTVTTDAELPMIYKDMTNTEEDVQCLIGPDLGPDGEEEHNGKYIAHFVNKTLNEQKTLRLEDLVHVNNFRNGLSLEGWRMYTQPKLSTNLKNENKPKTRKERREEERALKKKEKHKKAVQLRETKRKEEMEAKRKFALELAKQ